MNTTELVAACREISTTDADPDYSDSAILSLLNKSLVERFTQPLICVRQGYWRQTVTAAVTSGQASYRLPRRAVAGIVEQVEIQTSTGGSFLPVVPLTPGRVFQYQSSSTSGRAHYAIEGDDVVLYPTPTSAATLRIKYFLRPPTLQATQATTAGYVTAVNTTALTVVMSANTTQVADGGPPLITAAGALLTATPVDIVRPSGRFECSLVDGTSTLSSLTLTFAAGTDLTRVAVGDRVRQAGYTDWPQLPIELHQALCDYTAAVILANKGDLEKSQVFSSKAEQAIKRVTDVVVPRAKAQPPSLTPRYSYLRSRVRH